MPTLEWIGKDKVVNHHQQVPYRVLEEKYTYNAEKSDNMIIRGDNLSKGSINNYIRASNKMVYLVDNCIIVHKYQKSNR